MENLSNGTFPMQQKKYRWEIDPKTNEVVRVPSKSMHYQAFEDFKKILEMGAQKSGLGLSAKQRARMKRQRAHLNRDRRGSRSDCSSDAGLTPRQRTTRRRRRLRSKVHTELRKIDNTCKLMKVFPPIFTEQCDDISTNLGTLGTRFRDATNEVTSLESKIAQKKAHVEQMQQEYKIIIKRRNRLMFEKLAKKAKRVLARRRRVQDREDRKDAEERNRERSRSRNGRLNDNYMTEDEILEQMAQTEAHASMAMLLNEHLNAAAPPRSKTHIEHKLRIGECINGFLEENTVVASAAKDIIQEGVKEFRRANIKLIGGKVGEQSAFDKEFGTDFGEDEFVGYAEEDLADMTPEQQTRFFAWQRHGQKQKELELAERLVELQAEADTAQADSFSWMKQEEESDDGMEDIFGILADF